jgi:hypothetical protein
MLDFQSSPDILLATEAVTTAVSGLFAHTFTHFLRNPGSAHGVNGGRSPRLTASTKASVLRHQPL